jgi:hypothetical protein
MICLASFALMPSMSRCSSALISAVSPVHGRGSFHCRLSPRYASSVPLFRANVPLRLEQSRRTEKGSAKSLFVTLVFKFAYYEHQIGYFRVARHPALRTGCEHRGCDRLALARRLP